jgi:hypothetical protein
MQLPEKLLSTLKAGHPRLHATKEDFTALKEKIAGDETLKTWYDETIKRTDAILSEEPSIYIIPDGLRLLNTSRKVLGRITNLGFAYRMTGDKKYAERAWNELEACSKFPDWNPKHFLDVGEMTNAFALGYDWMFDYWNVDQKNIIKSAIIEKGLNRAMMAFEGRAVDNHSWWTKVEHNWNQVCNGGIGVGALAIADEEPRLAEYILRQVINNLPYAMIHFGPDGAWNEGPGYWGYSTQYNVAIISALNTSLGTDFGLSNIDGFSKTGLFPLYLTGPVRKSFNYADAGDGSTGGSQMFWFARKFNLPAAAAYQKKSRGGGPLDIIWYPSDLMKVQVPEMPLAAYYRAAEVATMRGAWNDDKTWFVGFKAGDNKANHSNLDIGSFVLDALGKRWVLDLGSDDYNAPGYFSTGRNGQRWTYYRMRAESHNTIVINPGQKADQDPLAAAKIINFGVKGNTAFAVADITPAYASEANSVQRGIALAGGKTVVIRDEIKAQKPADVWWFMHTRADVTVAGSGKTATLTIDGVKLVAEIVAPSNAKFSVMNASPLPSSPKPSGNNPNEGVRKLAINIKNVTDGKITVVIRPSEGKATETKTFNNSLKDWKL